MSRSPEGRGSGRTGLISHKFCAFQELPKHSAGALGGEKRSWGLQ